MIALSAVMVLLLILAVPAGAIRGGGHASAGGIGHAVSGAGTRSSADFTRPGWHGGGIYHGGVTPDHDFIRPGWHGGGVQWQPGWNDWNNYYQGWYGGGYPAWGGTWGSGYVDYGFSDCYTQCMYQGYGSTYCSQICPV